MEEKRQNPFEIEGYITAELVSLVHHSSDAAIPVIVNLHQLTRFRGPWEISALCYQR
jgi:hypothetical protein